MIEPTAQDRDPDVLDDALQTYPLVAAPFTLASGVMARLRNLPPTVRPRFRLSWLDYALGLFTTSMAGVGFIVWQSFPPQLVARLQVEWLILLQRLSFLAPYVPSLGG